MLMIGLHTQDGKFLHEQVVPYTDPPDVIIFQNRTFLHMSEADGTGTVYAAIYFEGSRYFLPPVIGQSMKPGETVWELGEQVPI